MCDRDDALPVKMSDESIIKDRGIFGLYMDVEVEKKSWMK